MVNFTFRGLVVPAFTPFDEDREMTILESYIIPYAQGIVQDGIQGILVNGTSGEGMSLSILERKRVVEAWMSFAKGSGQHIMVQVGGAPLPDVLELARHAEEVGAHSILCLPELYFKPTNANELVSYLQTVAKAAPNTPLLYYHIPSFTNVNIHMGKFLNENAHEIPTFCGIKFTSNNLDEALEALNARNKKYAVFLGADTLMFAAFAMGFDSAIATTLNIFPQIGKEILEECQKGNMHKARQAQEKLTRIVSIITKHGSWVPTMKEAMNLYTEVHIGPVRMPLLPLTEKQKEQMLIEMPQSFLCG